MASTSRSISSRVPLLTTARPSWCTAEASALALLTWIGEVRTEDVRHVVHEVDRVVPHDRHPGPGRHEVLAQMLRRRLDRSLDGSGGHSPMVPPIRRLHGTEGPDGRPSTLPFTHLESLVRTNTKTAVAGTGIATLVLAFAGPPLLAEQPTTSTRPASRRRRAGPTPTSPTSTPSRAGTPATPCSSSTPARARGHRAAGLRHGRAVHRQRRQNGDAKRDLAYVFRFGKGNGTGAGQAYTVTKYMGAPPHAR